MNAIYNGRGDVLENGFTRLNVRVSRKIWSGSDGYAVYDVLVLDTDKPEEMSVFSSDFITITGNFEDTYFPEEELYMYGERVDTKRGWQYKIGLVENKFDTITQMFDFISTMTSYTLASQLVNKYGSKVIDKIIDNEIDYSDIVGMGEYRYNALRDKVIENKYMKDIIIELSPYGVTPKQMSEIVNKFGANAVSRIKENPYILCKVRGIGFLKADDIAMKMKFPADSPNRIQEAINYAINQEQLKGNTWISKNRLVQECIKLTKLNRKIINENLKETEDVIVVDERIALKRLYDREKYIADTLKHIYDNSTELEYDVEGFFKRKEDNGVFLTDEQKNAIRNFLKYNVNFLVAPGGCGKSFIQGIIVEILKDLKKTFVLLAPTAKAAKVMTEYSHERASTVHRRIGFNGVTADDIITEDVVIVDETSMMDVDILYMMLRAILNLEKTRILFVGDDAQLPAVSVGNALHDNIIAGYFPLNKLTKVFRQKDGGILDIATRVRLNQKFIGNSFVGKKEYGKDLVFHSVKSEYLEKGYIHYYKEALTRYKPEDIMVLTPTKKGNLGTYAINKAIQSLVNPASEDKKELSVGEKHGIEIVYRVGDSVMNIKNTYGVKTVDNQSVDVINGDSGYIEDIEIEQKIFIINYGFARVAVPSSKMDNIVQSYAISVHRSQGSAAKCVIFVADKSHKFQLNSNLVYTALTRAKEFEYVLTQAETINYAMTKNANMKRNTFLGDFLVNKIA